MGKGGGKAGADLDRSVSQLLHRALQRALDIYAETGGPNAVTQRQYVVLAAVAADEGVTQAALVKTTGIDRSTLADLVGRMIDKGLLARERSSSDGRANAVRLAPAGRDALDAASPVAKAVDEAILAFLPGGKRNSFLKALSAVADAKPRKSSGNAKSGKRADPAKKAAKKARKDAKKAAGEPASAPA